MAANMNFEALNKSASGSRRVPKADLPVNLAVRLDKIELGQNGQPSFFHGVSVDGNEPVKVRMMTVNEGIDVNVRKGEALDDTRKRVQGMYVGNGEAHRPKPAEVANASHKTNCQPGGLLMFTKCLKNEDGTYRAHWVETLEREPGAGCDVVMANIRVREKAGKDGAPALKQVYADIVNPKAAVLLNQDNMVASLASALANTSNGADKRKPFATFRLLSAETGKVVLGPYRADALYAATKTSDADTGQEFTVYNAAPAEESVKNLFDPENNNADLRAVRAALHGLGSAEGYPDFKDATPEVVADLRKVTDLVRSGDLSVEVIPGERINAGPATRASIIKAVEKNPRHPVNNYVRRDDNGRVTGVNYAPTFLTTLVSQDGSRFFTKAVPADLYPKMETLKTLATANDFNASAAQAQARAADAVAPDRELPEDAEPVNPSAMDTIPGESAEDKLEQSAKQLADAGCVYD